MSVRKHWGSAGFLSAVLAVGAAFLWTSPCNAGEFEQGEVSQKAGDFTFPDLQGKLVRLSSFKGKTVLLDFWATWCGPCEDDIPGLNALQIKFKDKNFTVWAVSVDHASAKEVAHFVKAHQVSYPVALTGGEDNLPKGYAVFGLPTAYLIDASGVIRRTYFGPKDIKSVGADIEKILGSKKSRAVSAK